MAGIRLINQPPETFRFPEWRDDIFHSADTVIRYASFMNINDSDSDTRSRFYVAIKDVDPGSGIPKIRTDLWEEMFSGSLPSGLSVSQILDLDSDFASLKSELANIRIEKDSDDAVIRSDFDSDKNTMQHDFKAHDSDLNLLSSFDSDVGVFLALPSWDYGSGF